MGAPLCSLGLVSNWQFRRHPPGQTADQVVSKTFHSFFARNSELRHQVAELRAALELTTSSLKERRPNLPALRPPGPLTRFEDLR